MQTNPLTSALVVAGTYNSPTFDLVQDKNWAIRGDWTTVAANAKTFVSNVTATLVVQDITFTAVAKGVPGNSVTVAYTAGATAGSEVVTVVGSAISVQISTGVSTATQVKAKLDASAAALALATTSVTGTGSNAQVTAAATPLAGGITSKLNLATDAITIAAHGYANLTLVRLTTTTTLPTGLAGTTDYWVIAVDANTIKLANSYAHAVAGTAIDITGEGAGTHTVTATATVSLAAKLQWSLDGTGWEDVASSSQSIAATGSYGWFSTGPTAWRFMRVAFTYTSGQATVNLVAHCK